MEFQATEFPKWIFINTSIYTYIYGYIHTSTQFLNPIAYSLNNTRKHVQVHEEERLEKQAKSSV